MESDNGRVLSVRGLELRGPTATDGSAQRFFLPELALATGEAVALRGPSGCGKTSVLLGMLGLLGHLSQTAGTVWICGAPWPAKPRGRRSRLAQAVTVLLQDPKSALDPLRSVGDQILDCVRAASDEVRSSAVIREAAYAALDQLGIREPDALSRRIPSRISGGEAQRVLLAIALLRRPQLLVVDEPTAHLDAESRGAVKAALKQLRTTHGTAILMATHDDALVDELQARVWAERDGVFSVASAETAPAWPHCPAETNAADIDVAERPIVLAAAGLAAPPLFDGVDVILRRGDVVTLTGPSGIGKTTLARQLVGLDRLTTGAVHRPAGPRSVQLLWQDARASWTPGFSVRALVEEVQVPGFDLPAHAEFLGLDAAVLDRAVTQLSAGEIRRAALLRTLSVRPAVLVCDEPTSSLDRRTAVRVLDLLFTVREKFGVALWLITHDEDLARELGARTFTLAGGSLQPALSSASNSS